MWVVRELVLFFPLLFIVVWVASLREARDDLFWMMIGCAAVIPFLFAFILSNLYASAEKQHGGEPES